MEVAQDFESTNINGLWLNNIFENLKNLEMLERLGREGCTSIMDYLQIPIEQRELLVAETQYKNLRFMVTEISLLLTDLTPVIDEVEIKKFRESLKIVEENIANPQLFIKDTFSQAKNQIIRRQVTPFLYETVTYLSEIKIKIVQEISHILYVKKDARKGFGNR